MTKEQLIERWKNRLRREQIEWDTSWESKTKEELEAHCREQLRQKMNG